MMSSFPVLPNKIQGVFLYIGVIEKLFSEASKTYRFVSRPIMYIYIYTF